MEKTSSYSVISMAKTIMRYTFNQKQVMGQILTFSIFPENAYIVLDVSFCQG